MSPMPLDQKCEQEWLDADDLVQVAELGTDPRAALRANGIATMAATTPGGLVGVLSVATGAWLQQQAGLEVAERDGHGPAYALPPPEPGRGLQRLPEPSPGDVYLDFEGNPWANEGQGREYLAGTWEREQHFTGFWAQTVTPWSGPWVASARPETTPPWRASSPCCRRTS